MGDRDDGVTGGDDVTRSGNANLITLLNCNQHATLGQLDLQERLEPPIISLRWRYTTLVESTWDRFQMAHWLCWARAFCS